GTNLGLLDGSIDELPMFCRVEIFANDAAGRQEREIGDLAAQVLDRALPLLLDLGASPRDDALSILPRLRLELFPQIFTLFRDAVEDSLSLTPGLFEASLVLAFGCLALALPLRRRFPAL